MSAEDLRGRGRWSILYFREETVTSTLGAFQTNPQGFMEETTALCWAKQTLFLVKICKGPARYTNKKRNAAKWFTLDRVRRGPVYCGSPSNMEGVLQWKRFTPPISTSMLNRWLYDSWGKILSLQDFTNPHFIEFCHKNGVRAPIPRNV